MFARTELIFKESRISESNKIEIDLEFIAGNQIMLDSIAILGNVKLNPEYVSSLIGLKPGEPLNASRIEEIPDALKNLSFLRA